MIRVKYANNLYRLNIKNILEDRQDLVFLFDTGFRK